MENTIKDINKLSGITEIDEKSMNVSFSGNHKIQDEKSILPRKPYKRSRKSSKHKIETSFTSNNLFMHLYAISAKYSLKYFEDIP